MKSPLNLWTLAAAVALALAGCGGGGGIGLGSDSSSDGQTSASVGDTLTQASNSPDNDSATNSAAPFTVLQAAGIPAVTINSPPKINFTVFSDGAVVKNLKISNVSLAIAKLVPGTNGNPDEWKNYTSRNRTAATASPTGVYSDAVRATLTSPAAQSAWQATTDPKQTDPTLLANQLVYNADGYYTYTFRTDIKDPNWTATINNVQYATHGAVFEPGLTHRIALQLSYVNAAGATVKVNPYFDFTVDADGKSVPVDASKTRKMTDVNSCNSCHEKLALHGGGRVDTQFCVMCHNPGSVDPNSGNNLNLSTMVHKIHSAKLLAGNAAAGGGEFVTIRTDDFSEVGFPQDLRNCTKCHSGANPATPQGDNWKSKASKEACLTCHANKVGSDWEALHKKIAQDKTTNPAASGNFTEEALSLTNKQCGECHAAGLASGPENVHWNQNEENAAKYKMNIESATFNDTADHKGRTVTVKYYLSDPTNGDAAYNLVTSECTGAAPSITCSSTTKFGNLRFYLAYQNLVGQGTAVTEFSSYNNGGSNANAYAYKGTNDGANHYTVNIPLPDDTATSVAAGTARVITIGQIKEPLIDVTKKPREEVVPEVPANRVNVVVQNTFKDVALSGNLTPRRTVVASEKCNACHGALGTTSGANTLANAFHGGGRDIVEACSVCHDANRVSSTVMTNGMALNESFQFKRMIHGIHGNSKRTNPFTHGNPVKGFFDVTTGALKGAGSFLTDQKLTIGGVSTTVVAAGTPVADGATFESIAAIINTAATTAGYTGAPVAAAENYAAEVAWPGVGINCNVCHVNNSYKVDRSQLAAVVFKPLVGAAADPNPLNWQVISPKAASCTACHDSAAAIAHVTNTGGAIFGNKTQSDSRQNQEICSDCHASGGFKGVDIVHGQN